MPLRLHESINGKCTVERKFEEMGDKFVLVDINIEVEGIDTKYQNLSPLHWRIGDGKNPPLDISVNNHNKIIRGINFFIADEKILQKDIHIESSIEKGVPVFDNELWKNEEYYVDDIGSVRYFQFKNSICCILSEGKWNLSLELEDNLTLIFGIDNEVVAIIVECLTAEEILILEKAHLI